MLGEALRGFVLVVVFVGEVVHVEELACRGKGYREVRKLAWQNRMASPAWTAKPNPGHFALVSL